MRDAYEEATERGIRSTATAALVFRQRVASLLEEAGIPQAKMHWGGDEGLRCLRSGWLPVIPESATGSRVLDVAVTGRTDAPEAVRQGERDAIAQQARAALTAEGFEVRINEYGNLKVINR